MTWESAMTADSTRPAATASGSFAPLRQPVFAVLWAATVLGNIGSFMRDVASSWMVTELSASPAAVALIQTAATLPIFLLAIPAGVLSDILDRRRFLIGIQILLAAVSASLLLARTNTLTVEYLVALTFVGGIGAALMGPDRKSTRLNSSHSQISYAVFCLKKKEQAQGGTPHAGSAGLQTQLRQA